MDEDNERQWPSTFLMLGIGVEGGILLLALALGLGMEPKPWEQLRWQMREIGAGLLATWPLLLVFVLFCHSRLGPCRRIMRLFEEHLLPALEGVSILELAIVCCLAGLGEELLFRGVFQTFACRQLGVYPGIALASVLFGLVHAATPGYAVVAGVIGGYLGLLFYALDNLAPAIIAHALYDFVALYYLRHVYRPR